MAGKRENKLTPAMKQFHHFKKQYPDSILFFRMGDFYETFYEDAEICSRVCGLTLTSRDKGSNPIPLAGVPYHAAEGYLKKMLGAGYKVAVCEQVEDPKDAKGVVKRDVLRVVTPGTLTDDTMLQAKQENYLCGVWLGANGQASISYVDISTGHFFAEKVEEPKLVDELIRLGPAEVLVADMRGHLFEKQMNKLTGEISELTSAAVTERPGWYFDMRQSEKRLLKHFGTATLEGFGIDDGDEVIRPAGAVLEYLNETQKTTLGHIQGIRKVERRDYLQIDATSLQSLEILRTIRSESRRGSLLYCLDQTQTGMGGRMFRGWLCGPLCDAGAIGLRQDFVEELVENSEVLEQLREQLAGFADTERIAARVSTYRANPRDLVSLAETLGKVPEIRGVLESMESELAGKLGEGCDSMDELAEVLEAGIEPECPSHLRDGGVIREGFNQQLDKLRDIGTGGQEWLRDYQRQLAERTGIANVKVGYNKVFGYYIEVSHANAKRVPEDFVRKQTLKNAERYITDELKRFETQVLDAREKALELEVKIFEQLRDRTAEYVRRLQGLADTVANVDCLAGLGQLARRRGYVRPVVSEGRELKIEEGRHPVLNETLGSEFVANDVEMGEGAGDVVVITGPNMSGKSTYIRQTALLVIMAQVGSFIPAQSARVGLVDRIFTRVGASDELVRGQSTFMVEMTETANIVNNASDRSLVILDEIGRGTSTYDGLSLAWAVTEFLAKGVRCRTLFATHYHELTELAELFDNVKNCNVAVREWMDQVVFLHKIVPGGTDKSYGIHVAKLAGVPDSIIERSKEILRDLENTFTKEATGEKLGKHRTKKGDEDLLFVERNKPILEKLVSTDVNNLTPIEAINLLNQIKSKIKSDES